MAPKRRMSGTVPDAEKRLRIAMADTGVDGRRPAGEQRGGVEERQRRVDHVGRAELGDPGHVDPGAPDPPLRAAHCLGQAGGARREDEQEQIVVGRLVGAGREGGGGAELAHVGGVVDQQHTVR